MTRKIFDIYSSDTFNQIDWMFNRNDIKKEPNFPPWLRLPTFYTIGLWKRIIEFQDGMFYFKLVDSNKFVVKLECKYIHEISEITLQLVNKNINRIIVNCVACGGTGYTKTL